MQQGQPFLSNAAASSNLQSIITALQDLVRAANQVNTSISAVLTNLASPT